MSAVQPTATGSLQITPLPHVLVYVLDRRLTGTLVLEEPNGSKHAVWFESGAPVKVKTAEPVCYLGELLVEMGAIDEQTCNKTLAEAASGRRLHGVVLLSQQAIDRGTLQLALCEQLERKVAWLFNLPSDCIYGFYVQQNFLQRWGGDEVPRVLPLALLTRGLRQHASAEHVDATLAKLAAGSLRLHRDSRVGLFKLDEREQAVADVIRARPHGLAELLAGGVGEVGLVRRVVYLLAITRHLDLGLPGQRPIGLDNPSGEGASSAASSHPSTAPAQGRGVVRPLAQDSSSLPSGPPSPGAQAAEDPEVQQRIVQMEKSAERLAGQNYYQILGVSPEASKAGIQAAFFELAKTWHPDRLTGKMAAVRDVAMRAFARMSEAHQVLCDDERRADYDALLREGGGSAEEQEQVARVLRAVAHFQKAEVLHKKGNLSAAEQEAQAAVENDPDQPEYVALLAWITAQKPERVRLGQYDDLVRQLGAVVKQHPSHERARFYRAQLLKRSGREDLAIKDFLWIAEHHPKNLDAAREIRLYRMRKGDERSAGRKSAGSAGKPGLLGKLFKR